jgi:hypothetical protein
MRENVLPLLEAGGVDVVLAGHSHVYERSYLIDGVYGYGSAPNFATPSFTTLQADGHILDAGNGNPSGNGAYQKNPGGNSHDGTVYVVAGHGGHGLDTNAPGNHPVMAVFDVTFGSVLLDISGNSLTLQNLRTGGAISDTVAIQKAQTGTNLPPHGVIDTPNGAQTIVVGQSLIFSGSATDAEPNLPLTHRWNFGAGSGIADATVKDPGSRTFNTVGVFTVTYTVTDALGLPDPTPATVQVTVNSTSGPPPPLARSGWVVSVDSEETPSYVGTNVIDGNSSTLWHTRFSGGSPPYPHSLVVDLGAVATIQGFRALPRPDPGVNGRIGQYQFYVKTNSGTPPTTPTNPVLGEWTLVASGTFPNTAAEQQVLFGAVTSRYVWLRAISEVQGTNKPWTSLAEFNVLGTP